VSISFATFFRLLPLAVVICPAVLLDAQTKPAETRAVVVVTGTYQEIPLEEAERAVRVIPARELASTAGTISDLLNLDSSVDLRERAPGGVQSGVSIRGGSLGQTLVLWNGMRLNSMQSSNLNMDVPIPLDALSQVEVLKGSGSTLYGSDATAGVVNFRTQPPERSEVRLRTGFGNWGTQQQRASVAYVRGPLSQNWTASRDFSTGFLPNRDFRNLSVASTTAWRRTSLNLAHNDRPFGAEQFYGNFNSWERTKNWFSGVRQGIGEKTEAAFAYRRSTDLFVLYRDRPQVFTNRHIVETYQGQLRRREDLGGAGRLHYGGEVLSDSISSNNLGNHGRTRGALYVALDLRAMRRFSFTIGLRDEVYRNFQHQFSPSAAFGWWVNSRLKLRASSSTAFRLPTYTDLYYRDPANVGNALLRPEKAWSNEAGLDWNPGGRWRGSFTIFERRERDGIDFVRANPSDLWRATNFQKLVFRGVEASSFVALPKSQRLEFSYTGLSGAQAALAGLQSKYVFNYARHTGLASWQAVLGRDWIARSRFGAIERLGRSPYVVWDVFTSWQRGRVQPYLQVTNLTASRYEEFVGIRMPGRGVVGGVEVLWRAR